MTNAKLVASQKAVDRLKPNSSIAKWSIRLLLSPLLPVYLIVSSLESLIREIIVFFYCSWIFGRFFCYEGKVETFLHSCQKSGDWEHRTAAVFCTWILTELLENRQSKNVRSELRRVFFELSWEWSRV